MSVLALLLTAAAVGIFGASGTITRLIKRSYRNYRTVLLALRAGGLVALGFGIAGTALDSRLLLLTSAGVLVFSLMLAVVATVFERIAPSAPLNQESILIVAAHPDDLEIACGATTAKLIDQGYSVHALILADGKDGGEVAGRAGEATNGAEFLGLASLTMLALPDRALDQNMKEMIAAIEAEIEKYQPTLIFTHSIHDVHQDHVAVHKAGTGLVRRAFDVLGVVPVISGNSGAFRRACLDDMARSNPGHPLREDTVGEDLELTWQILTSPWKVVFAPDALVYAESPSSVRALYKQRTRWARGLLQSLQLYWRHLFDFSYPRFSCLLWFIVVTMVFTPVLQIVLLIFGVAQLPNADFSELGIILGSGLLLSTVLLIITMVMAGSLRDLRHIWTLPLWPVYSLAMSFTMLSALLQELRRAEQVWNKPERTGVISYEQQISRHGARAASESATERQMGQHGDVVGPGVVSGTGTRFRPRRETEPRG